MLTQQQQRILYNKIVEKETSKYFDLNIDKILEHWEPFHAIRELIANASDETILTNCKKDFVLTASNDNTCLTIRDYGRGLKPLYLMQNESSEKLAHSGVVGKFGIGLKDAFATFDRHNIKIKIISKHGIISIVKKNKNNFDKIQSLHAKIESSHPDFVGTQIEISGLKPLDIILAKEQFLKYDSKEVLQETPYGTVYKRELWEPASIYINGSKISSEQNFLFHYDITNPSRDMRKSLNRERTNVGRKAFEQSIVKILLHSPLLVETLSDNLKQTESTSCDELTYDEVLIHVIRHMKDCCFLTLEQMSNSTWVQRIVAAKKTIIKVSKQIAEKIERVYDIRGVLVMTGNYFATTFDDSIKFDFVKYNDLTPLEKKIFDKNDEILSLLGWKTSSLISIKISNTLENKILGLWDPKTNSVVIRRDQLTSLTKYCGVLLHEYTHYMTQLKDGTIAFESHLTESIGELAAKLIACKVENKVYQSMFE